MDKNRVNPPLKTFNDEGTGVVRKRKLTLGKEEDSLQNTNEGSTPKRKPELTLKSCSYERETDSEISCDSQLFSEIKIEYEEVEASLQESVYKKDATNGLDSEMLLGMLGTTQEVGKKEEQELSNVLQPSQKLSNVLQPAEKLSNNLVVPSSKIELGSNTTLESPRESNTSVAISQDATHGINTAIGEIKQELHECVWINEENAFMQQDPLFSSDTRAEKERIDVLQSSVQNKSHKKFVECYKCNQYFSSADEYFKHIGSIARKYTSWQCVSCHSVFTTRREFKKHLILKHDSRTKYTPVVDVLLLKQFIIKPHCAGKVLAQPSSKGRCPGLDQYLASMHPTEKHNGQVLLQESTSANSQSTSDELSFTTEQRVHTGVKCNEVTRKNPGADEVLVQQSTSTDPNKNGANQVLTQTSTVNSSIEKQKHHFISTGPMLKCVQVMAQPSTVTDSKEKRPALNKTFISTGPMLKCIQVPAQKSTATGSIEKRPLLNQQFVINGQLLQCVQVMAQPSTVTGSIEKRPGLNQNFVSAGPLLKCVQVPAQSSTATALIEKRPALNQTFLSTGPMLKFVQVTAQSSTATDSREKRTVLKQTYVSTGPLIKCFQVPVQNSTSSIDKSLGLKQQIVSTGSTEMGTGQELTQHFLDMGSLETTLAQEEQLVSTNTKEMGTAQVLTQRSVSTGLKEMDDSQVLIQHFVDIGSEKCSELKHEFVSTGSTEMGTGQVLTGHDVSTGSITKFSKLEHEFVTTGPTEMGTGQVPTGLDISTGSTEKYSEMEHEFVSTGPTEMGTGQVPTGHDISTGSTEKCSELDQKCVPFVISANSIENMCTFTTCFKCKLLFKTSEEFLSHACETIKKCQFEDTEESEITWCELCGREFDTKRGLDLHILRIHPSNKNSQVSAEPSEIPRPYVKPYNYPYRELYNHFVMYHIQTNQPENRSISYAFLIETYDFNRRNSSVCLGCGKKCNNEGNTNHVHPCYKNKKLIQCKICKKCHVDLKTMENHLKDEHKQYWNFSVEQDTLYSCSACEKLYAPCKTQEDNYDLMEQESSVNFQHIEIFRIIDDDTQFFKYKLKTRYNHCPWIYTCILCRSTCFFNTAQELNVHCKSIHEDVAFKTCLKCDQKCYNMNQFYDHAQNICRNDELNFDHFDNDDMKIVKCDDCSLKFDNNCSLKLHQFPVDPYYEIKLINGKYSCPNCQVIFSGEKLFFAHCHPYTLVSSESFKNSDDQIKCRLCGVKRESKTKLNTHVTQGHNVQLLHCTKCFTDLKIKPIDATLNHFFNCNSTKKAGQLFSCPTCGLRLESFKKLMNHINLDIKLLPRRKFQCRHCLNFFFSEYNLCAHLMSSKCLSCNLYFCGRLTEHFELNECNVVSSNTPNDHHNYLNGGPALKFLDI